ncbi:unnamed protein product, partial [Ectocarpus sp. 12 AP-2014]
PPPAAGRFRFVARAEEERPPLGLSSPEGGAAAGVGGAVCLPAISSTRRRSLESGSLSFWPPSVVFFFPLVEIPGLFAPALGLVALLLCLLAPGVAAAIALPAPFARSVPLRPCCPAEPLATAVTAAVSMLSLWALLLLLLLLLVLFTADDWGRGWSFPSDPPFPCCCVCFAVLSLSLLMLVVVVDCRFFFLSQALPLARFFF